MTPIFCTSLTNRLVNYEHDAFGFDEIGLTDNIDLSCGFGLGDQEAQRIATAMTAIIVAYGGKTELPDHFLNNADEGGNGKN